MEVTLVVDALSPRLTGVGRYVSELCMRLPSDPRVCRLGFFAHGRYVDDVQWRLGNRAGRRPFRLPKWIGSREVKRQLRRSVVHGPNYFLPPEADTGVITVHDLSVFRHPEAHPSKRIRAFEQQFGNALSRAAHVITDSESVRTELIADFGVSPARVTAVYLGVTSEFHPRADLTLEGDLARLQVVPRQYALCVSTLEPRKRVSELIRAWRSLPAIIRATTPLVIAGAQGWLNDQLHAEIGDAVAEGWLRYAGYVSDADLLALYAGAALFIYPSTYEGFGLPPLEAMASGVPVLVANRSCLPEICGDAAGYVDPDDVSAFSEAIVKALTDDEWRVEARQRGLERAATFTWDRCVAATVNIYGSVFR